MDCDLFLVIKSLSACMNMSGLRQIPRIHCSQLQSNIKCLVMMIKWGCCVVFLSFCLHPFSLDMKHIQPSPSGFTRDLKLCFLNFLLILFSNACSLSKDLCDKGHVLEPRGVQYVLWTFLFSCTELWKSQWKLVVGECKVMLHVTSCSNEQMSLAFLGVYLVLTVFQI